MQREGGAYGVGRRGRRGEEGGLVVLHTEVEACLGHPLGEARAPVRLRGALQAESTGAHVDGRGGVEGAAGGVRVRILVRVRRAEGVEGELVAPIVLDVAGCVAATGHVARRARGVGARQRADGGRGRVVGGGGGSGRRAEAPRETGGVHSRQCGRRPWKKVLVADKRRIAAFASLTSTLLAGCV